MIACSTFYYEFTGRWIPQLCFLWIFVCTAVRWPSQAALGNIPGQGYYFQGYLASFVTQFIIVLVLYFDKPMTLADYQAGLGYVSSDEEEDEFRHSTMSFRLENIQSSQGLSNPLQTELHVSVAVESKEMRSVQWSEARNPEGSAFIFSRMIFSWMSPIFYYAHKNTLKESDIWDLRAMFRFVSLSLSYFSSDVIVFVVSGRVLISNTLLKCGLKRRLIQLQMRNHLFAAQ
jgi:hypothetical protein